MKKSLAFLIICFPFLLTAQMEILDYTYAQSAVKDQGSRGTCTAFGICAAFEVSPFVPSDMSEQYIFAMIKYNHYEYRNFVFADKPEADYLSDEGEMLKNYINAIQFSGLITEEEMPYDPTAPLATNDLDLFNQYMDITKNVPAEIFETARRESFKVREGQYTYLDKDMVGDRELIKSYLNQGVKAIPVSYAILQQAWFDKEVSADSDHPLIGLGDIFEVSFLGSWINPDEFPYLGSDFLDRLVNGEIPLKSLYYNPEDWSPVVVDGGHCVTIVGYTPRGFIIKNSWGKDWGKSGYAVVSYDYHQLFSQEALILKDFKIEKTSLFGPFDILTKDHLRLKFLPERKQNTLVNTRMSLFYHGPKVMPKLDRVSVEFYAQKTNEFIASSEMPTDEAAQNAAFATNIIPALVTFKMHFGEPVRARVRVFYNSENLSPRVVEAWFDNLEWKNETYKAR